MTPGLKNRIFVVTSQQDGRICVRLRTTSFVVARKTAVLLDRKEGRVRIGVLVT